MELPGQYEGTGEGNAVTRRTTKSKPELIKSITTDDVARIGTTPCPKCGTRTFDKHMLEFHKGVGFSLWILFCWRYPFEHFHVHCFKCSYTWVEYVEGSN